MFELNLSFWFLILSVLSRHFYYITIKEPWSSDSHTCTLYMPSSPTPIDTVHTYNTHTSTHHPPQRLRVSSFLSAVTDWRCCVASGQMSLSLSLSLSLSVCVCTIMRLLDTDSPGWLRVSSHQFWLCAYFVNAIESFVCVWLDEYL